MADDNTPPEHVPSGISKAELEAHKREWEAHVRSLKDDMSALHAEDTAEREKLKLELAEATEYIKQLKEAESKRDEVKSSKSTLVLPPDDIPAQQPNVSPQTAQTPAKKQGILKSWW